jgi:hypothetical protein
LDDKNPVRRGDPGRDGAAFTSSPPAGESPPADPVALLGEQILAELGDPRTNSMLIRWLSHYTARLISEARIARDSGDPQADVLEANARDGILDLWQARSAWPSGWPPPMAAKTARQLEQLPGPDDEIYWYRPTKLQWLHAVHYQILSVLVDLLLAADAPGSTTDMERMWLDRHGEHLTPDEATVLRLAAGVPDRLDAIFRWSPSASAAQQHSGQETGAASEDGFKDLLRRLANAYQTAITDLLPPNDSETAEDPPGDDTSDSFPA